MKNKGIKTSGRASKQHFLLESQPLFSLGDVPLVDCCVLKHPDISGGTAYNDWQADVPRGGEGSQRLGLLDPVQEQKVGFWIQSIQDSSEVTKGFQQVKPRFFSFFFANWALGITEAGLKHWIK